MEGTVRLKWETTPQSWNGERVEAKQPVSTYDHTEELARRHLNVFEHRGEIRDRLPRGGETTTGKINRVTPPWEACVNTSPWRFKATALLLVRQTPVAVVARWHDTREQPPPMVKDAQGAGRRASSENRIESCDLRRLRRDARAPGASLRQRVSRTDGPTRADRGPRQRPESVGDFHGRTGVAQRHPQARAITEEKVRPAPLRACQRLLIPSRERVLGRGHGFRVSDY
ncbi:MAG: hypothetical protein RL077_1221 [Verrucomicrobiota bacterium]